jgi:hypothetical protein
MKKRNWISYGTSYFRSVVHAEFYYRSQFGEATRDVVADKLKNGEIHLGYPPLQAGDTCFLIDNGTRWAIRKPGHES